MRTPGLRYALFAVLIIAPTMIGMAGTVLYVEGGHSGPAVQELPSCPSPTAAFSERKKTAMPLTTHKASLPLLDREIPSYLEIATFGLG